MKSQVHGFEDEELPDRRMVREVKRIYRATTWPQFFVKKLSGKEGFSDSLMVMVRESARRG